MTRPDLLSLAERLMARASELTADIMTGPDHPNLQSELDRMNAARAMREAAALLRKLAELEPVAWQWRKLDSHWSLDRTFNSEVFVTTVDSERRALYQLSEVLTDE